LSSEKFGAFLAGYATYASRQA